MDFFRKLKRLFTRESLRDKCVKMYGEDFGEIYDTLGSGGVVGGFAETLACLDMIEDVRNGTVREHECREQEPPTRIEVTGVYIPEN